MERKDETNEPAIEQVNIIYCFLFTAQLKGGGEIEEIAWIAGATLHNEVIGNFFRFYFKPEVKRALFG